MWKLFLGLLAVAHACSAHITQQEFTQCVTACGYRPPSPDIYEHFNKATISFSREELAMFLAQLIHESGGFQYREEIQYAGNNWHSAYKDNVGLPGKTYHGRGFIQLTWGANYKACSEGLGLGDYLLRNPEAVAQSTKLSVDVSVWYWCDRVRPQIRFKENQFGATTKAINGALECTHWNERAANRYRLYLKVAGVLKIQKKAVENGCYN
uniref:Putative endochitinase 1 n=1 Tax=Spalangia cameroni TaxID=162946 RepID=A0A0U3T979_9HYME|nr:putative endochitinase 1 [Spalangia cameroni]